MITRNDIDRLAGTDVYGPGDEKIGSVGGVYLGARNGEPEWVTVKTGLFGSKETFVPLSKADLNDGRLTVPFDKDTVKDAPRIDADGNLNPSEEDDLYRHYGLSSPAAGDFGGGNSGTATYDADTRGEGRDRRDDGDAMTRSEERLVAGTERERTGKARLRKYVVSEEQQVNVPVTREEVRLEREPITDGNRGDAFAGPDITESEHEVTLHREKPVVDTEAVPVERVRLGKETVRDEEQVSGQVRKEQIEFDDPEDRGRR